MRDEFSENVYDEHNLQSRINTLETRFIFTFQGDGL